MPFAAVVIGALRVNGALRLIVSVKKVTKIIAKDHNIFINGISIILITKYKLPWMISVTFYGTSATDPTESIKS